MLKHRYIESLQKLKKIKQTMPSSFRECIYSPSSSKFSFQDVSVQVNAGSKCGLTILFRKKDPSRYFNYIPISFEEFIEFLDDDLKEYFIYNLDLFIGGR